VQADIAGKKTFADVVLTTADIDGGTIDGAVIGGAVAAAGTFTTGTIDTADINGGAIDGTIIGGNAAVAGTFTTGTIDTADINGGTIDGTIINGGTIDGTIIGGNAAVAITGTAITGTVITGINLILSGNIAVEDTVDGRVISTDGTKLDTIEASADVTDTANVTTAGALMDSELADITSVKALNQGVGTSDSPTFVNVTATSLDISGDIDVDGTTNLDVVDIDGAVDIATTLTVGGGITGDVTGNVTGNTSGTAATVTGAAQTAITSVGTLTSLSTSGNVGVGSTPDAWSSTFDALTIGPNNSSIFARSDNNVFGTTSNAYVNSGGSWAYANDGLATLTECLNGEHSWFTAATGTADNTITFSKRMSIDPASGQVLIGVSGPSGYGQLDTTTFTTSSSCNLARDGGEVCIGTVTAIEKLTVGGNVSADGIVFDAVTGSATSNTLSDYEEGTWTPVYTASTTSPSYTLDSLTKGYYVKVGSVVTLTGRIRTDDVTNTPAGDLRLSGFPFTAKDTTQIRQGGTLMVGEAKSFEDAYFPSTGTVQDNDSYAYLSRRTSAHGVTSVVPAVDALKTGTNNCNELSFTVQYLTDA
jgi:hypothetical protein